MMETIHIKLVKSEPDDKRLWFHIYVGREFVDHFSMSPLHKKVDYADHWDGDAPLAWALLRNVLKRELAKESS